MSKTSRTVPRAFARPLQTNVLFLTCAAAAFAGAVMSTSVLAQAQTAKRVTASTTSSQAAQAEQFELQKKRIQTTISAQIAAFQADDAEQAFSFAAPGIQSRFGTPQAFIEMVRTAYAPVFRPNRVEFLSLSPSPRGVIQKVLLQGPDGSITFAYYAMLLIDGDWRIAGCQLTRSEETI